jgi:hypothetical protein
MERRTLLRLGLGGAAILALAGGTAALFRPGVVDDRLSPEGRQVFRAVARAVLASVLPTPEAEASMAIDALMSRLDTTIAGFPGPVKDELSLLLSLLAAAPGRIGLAGLGSSWQAATVEDVQAALQSMRLSGVALRQQAYHALRDLTNAAYFADPATWPKLGYPGPREV